MQSEGVRSSTALAQQGTRRRCCQASIAKEEGDVVKERKFSRVPVGTQASFSWGRKKGEANQGEGVTRDISAGGMYLYTKTPPPVGSPVKLELLLPKVRGAMHALRMKVMGRVVRVQPTEDPDEQISGFAAVTDEFVLQEPATDEQESAPRGSSPRR
jgi:hypothetical protein